MKDDFELPPIRREQDYPMTMEELELAAEIEKPDLSDVERLSLSDMEGNPVEAPIQKDFKAAGRLSSIKREKALDAHRKQFIPTKANLDMFYVRNEEGFREARTGMEKAIFAGTVFIFADLGFMLSCFSAANLIMVIAQIVLCFTFMRSSDRARKWLSGFCVVNFFITLMNIFARIEYSVPDNAVSAYFNGNPLLLLLYVVLAIIFAALSIYIRFNRYIEQYCLRAIGLTDEYLDENDVE